MRGERDLEALLRRASPKRVEGEYVFVPAGRAAEAMRALSSLAPAGPPA